jgi:hypothetical protein
MFLAATFLAALLSVDGDEAAAVGYGGNLCPRLETMALLKIPSDMDAVFWDARSFATLNHTLNSKKG